jgi:hypothetical protein
MNRKIRLVIGLILLALSISFLIWGYSPNPREIRERMIPPAELQLPTPSSLHFTPEPVS